MKKTRLTLLLALASLSIPACLISTGCGNQADKSTIDAAPPTAPNAKAPAPVTNKPNPVGGDSVSGGGGNTPSAASESAESGK
jgi:hypothetical protein